MTRYDLSERAVGFFRFFATPVPGFTDQATSVVAAGLAGGEDPQEAPGIAGQRHRPVWRAAGRIRVRRRRARVAAVRGSPKATRAAGRGARRIRLTGADLIASVVAYRVRTE